MFFHTRPLGFDHFPRTLFLSIQFIKASMFNERIKSMGNGIAHYHAYDNTTNYQDCWESAVSPPPENATNVKECGCYIVKEKDESNRVWVTFTTYYTYLQKSHERIQK